MKDSRTRGTAPDGERAAVSAAVARRILNGTFIVFVVLAGILVVLMAVGLTWEGGQTPPESARRTEETASVIKVLLVLLFSSATIINLGIRWAGRIMAGRRYRRHDIRHAARAFAVSQWACFAVYGLFFAAAMYHRIAAAGQKGVLVVATLAAVLACFYFLKVPVFLLRAVFSPPESPGGEGFDKADSDRPAE